MARPDELLVVLARITPCAALAWVEHRWGSERLARTEWPTHRGWAAASVRISTPLLTREHELAHLLWEAPMGLPVTLGASADRVVVVLDRPRVRLRGCAVGWELCTTTRFERQDLTIMRILAPLFERPGAIGTERRPGGISSLTATELDILCLVGEGLTAVAVARRRGVSVRTVHKHLENAYRKIGCHDRVTAVLFAWRAGLLGTASSAAASPITASPATPSALVDGPESPYAWAAATAPRTTSPMTVTRSSSAPVTVTS